MIKNKSDWTVLSLKEYLETLLTEHFEKIDQQFLSMDKAVCKAEVATEKRFESVNEFRAQLADQSRTFIPRLEYELAHKLLSDKIDFLIQKLDRIESIKQGSTNTWAYVISGISLLIAVISIFLGVK